MSDNDVLAPLHKPRDLAPLAPEPAAKDASGDNDDDSMLELLRRVHRLLRGHYLMIILLGLICAAGGALVAWRRAPVAYRSEGLVRVAYTLPKVFTETDQNRPMDLFDAFLNAQKLLITSRRVVDAALQEPAWQVTGLGNGPAVVADFAGNLEVEVKANNEYIRIAYRDRNPAVAAAAVKALVSAYLKEYEGQDHTVEAQVLSAATARRDTIVNELDDINAKVEAISKEFGTANLDPLHDSAVRRVTKLEEALSDVQLNIARVPDDQKDGAAVAPLTSKELRIAQLATRDQTMRGYCDELSRAKQTLDVATLSYGDGHRNVVSAKLALKAAQDRVDEYVEQARIADPANSAGAALGQIKPLPVLLTEETSVKKLLEEARAKMVALGQQRWSLQELLKLRTERVDELTKTNDRLETLRSEGSLGGRLSVISAGEVPLWPIRDLRMPFTIAGAGAGAIFPSLVFLAWAFFRGRYRYTEDAESALGQTMPMLGAIPLLDDRDLSRDAIAAQCIHQIRVNLQAAGVNEQSRVFLISSSTAGEGKTSLTLALGLSFAASGVRTLVMDCDLTGRRITRGFSGEKSPGLPEALATGHVNGFVQEAMAGLSVLTAGSARAHDASTMGAAYMRRLLNSAREEYSVILIDTGPLLGSIEASMASREVDGVVLTIGRGQDQSLVRRAVAQLSMLSAPIAGIVFNRAHAQDLKSSMYATSMQQPEDEASAETCESPFGPLIRAVLGSLPQALRSAN